MIDYLFLAIGRVGSASELITEKFEQVEYRDKDRKLVDLLSELEGKKLIFVQTKRKADELEWTLSNNFDIQTEAIHGDRSQGEREAALNNFRTGKSEVLIG